MKNCNNPVIIIRGLLGALCVVITVLANQKIVLAESTTDDLRAFLGITVEKHKEKNRYESNYNEIIQNTDNKNSNVHIEKETELSEIDILNINLNLYGTELNLMFMSDSSPYEISSKLTEITETKERIKALGYSTSSGTILDDTINNEYDSNKLTVYESKNDIDSRWYNIGSIGSSLKPCVNNTFIVRPFGYEVEYNSDYETYTPIGDKNRGLWLHASKGDNVMAQYNGIVLSIEDDPNGVNTKNICIKHGNGVFTVYKHIMLKDKIKVNSIVKQYDIIGSAGKSNEKDYDNHIEIELIIDKMYVNPLLMYGTSGKGMYENFIRSSSKEYAVEKGEGYYWIKSMALENPNKS